MATVAAVELLATAASEIVEQQADSAALQQTSQHVAFEHQAQVYLSPDGGAVAGLQVQQVAIAVAPSGLETKGSEENGASTARFRGSEVQTTLAGSVRPDAALDPLPGSPQFPLCELLAFCP